MVRACSTFVFLYWLKANAMVGGGYKPAPMEVDKIDIGLQLNLKKDFVSVQGY